MLIFYVMIGFETQKEIIRGKFTKAIREAAVNGCSTTFGMPKSPEVKNEMPEHKFIWDIE